MINNDLSDESSTHQRFAMLTEADIEFRKFEELMTEERRQ